MIQHHNEFVYCETIVYGLLQDSTKCTISY